MHETERKLRAQQLVADAIRRGELERPDWCSLCGTAGVKIIAHHGDYTRPLDVAWVCEPCHGKIHADGEDKPPAFHTRMEPRLRRWVKVQAAQEGRRMWKLIERAIVHYRASVEAVKEQVDHEED